MVSIMVFQEEIIRKANNELTRANYAIIERIPLPVEHFKAQREGNTTNLLLMPTTEGYFHIYVDWSLEYLGNNLPEDIFTNEERNGWRRLAIPNDGDMASTLKVVATVFGLDGDTPQIPTEGEKQKAQKTNDHKIEKADSKTGSLDKKLEEFGVDLTLLAEQKKLNPVIGREKEMQKITGILLKHGKNAPLLIGEPGVGKSAIVEGLAQWIVERKVIDELLDSRIIEINLSLLSAGASMKGMLEDRVKNIVNAAKGDSRIILFFDELHTIFSTSGDNNIGTMLKSDLARGTFKVIGATTYRDYKQSIEKDGALARRFQKVLVNEPSEEQTIEILKGLRNHLEAHHNVKISDEVIQEAVKLSAWYITDRYLPDKAIDLIDEASVKMRLSKEMVEMTDETAETEIVESEMTFEEALQQGEYTIARKLLESREVILNAKT